MTFPPWLPVAPNIVRSRLEDMVESFLRSDEVQVQDNNGCSFL